MSKDIDITVLTMGGQSWKMVVSTSNTVGELKLQLSSLTSNPVDKMKLINSGVVLQSDDQPLEFYGIKDNATIHMVITQDPSTTSNASANNNNENYENFLSQVMDNNPMFQQMFNNTELMQSMINSNPLIQKIMENNPETRHIFNDPSTIRQMSKVMQNPNLRKEMMRNADRAMANLESIPGGFNELRKLHNSIEGPLGESLIPGSSQKPSSESETKVDVDPSKPTTTPLPNPWGPRPQNQMGLGFGSPFSGLPAQNLSGLQLPNLSQNTQPPLFPLSPNLFQFPNTTLPTTNTSQTNTQNQNTQNMFNPYSFGSNTGINPYAAMFNPGMQQQLNPITPSPFTGLNPNETPEERYAAQLQQLNDMGFTNRDLNIQALKEVQGNVDRAVEKLLGQ